MNSLILTLSLVASSVSWGALTVRAENASNEATPTGSTKVYYYSNISNTDTGNTYGNAGGGDCSTARNPNCRKTTSPFYIYATPSKSGGKLTLVARNVAVSTGTSFGAGEGFVTSLASYTPNAENKFSTTFGDICLAANAAGTYAASVDSTCGPSSGVSANIIVSVIADTGGDGSYDSSVDEVGYFTLTIKSSIIHKSNMSGFQAGIFEFTTFPGDEKVKFRDISFDENFPTNTGTIGAQYVRFYYTAGTSSYDANTFNNVVAAFGGSPYFETTANENGEFGKSFVDGLQNDIYYYFKVALVDYAGNIGYISDDAIDNVVSHAARPSQVIGLLAENAGCFIATAAYGSSLAPQVRTLRQFRDLFLMQTTPGRQFVHYYYKYSPPVAEVIDARPWLKSATRAALYPVVGYAWLANRVGPADAMILLVTLLLIPILVWKWNQNGRQMWPKREPRD